MQISNMTPSAANTIILEADHKNTSMAAYIQGAAVVFQNGYNNTEVNPEYGAKLTAEQRDIIYEAGRMAAEENATKEQARKNSANKKAATENSSATVKKGGVYYGYEGQTISERVSSGKALNAKQSVGIQFAERIAKSRGITFYFYESYVDENGDRVYKDKDGNVKKAENGFYDPSDGSIHIDLNAGYDGKGTVLFTMSHELVHFVKDWSPKHFKQMANVIMKGYRQKNVPVDTLVKMQQANAQEHDRELSYDEAYEEVIADSMETILADGKVMELMRDIEKADKSLGQKIKEFFQDIVQLLKDTINAYRGVEPDTIEGTLVSQMDDLIAELQQVFAKGVYEAGDNYRKTEKNTTADDGDRIMFDSRISELADGDILELIENCNRGEYALRTFIPVRKDTPSILLEKSKLDGLKPLDNRPVIMLVEHVQQCMDDDVAAVDGKRGHALTAQNILDITKALDDPRYIFYQQDNGKYSLIVEYNIGKRNEKGMAIVDVTRDKNPDQMNGFEGGKYNILVTAYAPDSSYLRKYIRSENNRCIYDKIEDASQRSSGSLVPSLLNDSSSIPTLTQPQTVVKENDFAKSDKVKMSARKGETAKKALSHFGRTFSWKETGYLLTDGSKLDFSGRHEGASGGYRTVDHRDILDIYPEETELDGNGAMVDFMRQGNIRIMPEGDGINLQVQPTKTQEQALSDFISRARGEVTLDIDDAHGNTVVSVEYPRGTRATKVLQDIKNYFENGTEPVISELAKFHYSTRKKLNASVTELLQQENEKLKEDVQHLKDLLKLQRTVTGGTKFTKTSVEAAARMLKNVANTRGDTAELAKLLNSFYEGMATDKELTWESVREMAKPAVEWLQSHTEVKPERSEYAKDILNHLRTSRIYLDETQIKEAAHRYSSYDAYRKMTMGSIILAKEGSVSLDSKWQELSVMYPDVFDADISSSDMPEALVEAIGRLRNSDTSILEYEYNRDVIAQDLLRQVYDSYWRVSTLRTFADSKQREINKLKAQHYQRMDKLRAYNVAQIEQMKTDHRATIERINSENRQRLENQQKTIWQEYQESKKKAVESREKTVMRQKIRKVIRDLDKILNRGNKKRNVKEDMKDLVAQVIPMAYSIWELIVAVTVAALGSTGLWSYISTRSKKDTAERKLLVGLAHDRIIFLGTKYIERGYITMDDYENLNEYLFMPYSDAGGNGSAKRVMEEVRKLPLRN